ncbi:TPA: two-component sensor histidine kinase [Streptococcus equi subsp. zooepidemicus]|nr:two-component sensor histidine kinase [Streptococcus equi subsp. zooepidemicus]HEL0593028.1 two-component sensor histidine kinase [Streptococcus equi subsp. zooepidemicus]HEL0605143.1 two-component sensor histidine kinase [Streptococcus equi subsp. zooepidemicus]HEL0685621.1 two-component sensor histidine kinase [Streptococcus equi subsp. zooepidemicus]HEL1159810.1 two-component sensor histidine kinase [Streptococcus equi subsp. zooepidemicus]
MIGHLRRLSMLLGLCLLAALGLIWQGPHQVLTLIVLCTGLVASFYVLIMLFRWEREFRALHHHLLTASDHFLLVGQADLSAYAKQLTELKSDLLQKEARLKSLSKNVEAVTSHLTMGMLLVSNQRELLLTSKSLPAYFPEAKPPFVVLEDLKRMDLIALVNQVFDQKQTLKKELTGLHDGDLILEVTLVPIFNQSHVVKEVLVLLYDLTAIRHYERLNLEFIANASHELRTPVTSIKGFAETIKEMPDDETSLKEDFLDIIYNESLRLERIVEHLLTLSKVNKTPLDLTEFQLRSFLLYTGQSMRPQLEQKQLELSYALEDSIVVTSDQYLLSQIMLNLLSNAIQYTDNGGRIQLSSQRVAGGVAITVADTGIGISQIELDRIFERFYRVNKGRSRQSGGTGLGLAIVKELSQLLGGQITVTSQLGEGSQFTLFLPEAINK